MAKQLADIQIENYMSQEKLEAKNDELIRNVQQADDEIPICEELTLAGKLECIFS